MTRRDVSTGLKLQGAKGPIEPETSENSKQRKSNKKKVTLGVDPKIPKRDKTEEDLLFSYLFRYFRFGPQSHFFVAFSVL